MTKDDRFDSTIDFRDYKAFFKGVILIVALLVIGLIYMVACVRTSGMQDDYSSVLASERYAAPVYVEGVEAAEVQVSSKYAAVEMLAAWSGSDVTEDTLNEHYAIYNELWSQHSFGYLVDRWLPGLSVTRRWYLSDSDLLTTVYEGLESGVPVPVEWARKSHGAWTTEFMLVVGMDVANDCLTVTNPDGYFEELNIAEFLTRTHGDDGTEKPLALFSAGLDGRFLRNTVYVVRSR